jgi:hypothetical protein
MRRILMVGDDRHTRLAIGICSSNAGSGSRSRTVARAVLPKTCRTARRHCERDAKHFEREGKYGLNCQGEAMRRLLLSSTLRRRRKSPAPPVKPEKPDSPMMIATDE